MAFQARTLAAVVAAGFAMSAYAAGSITGLLVMPSNTPLPGGAATAVALVGESVQLKVLGSGACSQLMVDTGEGQPTMMGGMPQASFFLPATDKLTFQSAGLKQIKVKSAAPNGCAGEGTVSIAIASASKFSAGSLKMVTAAGDPPKFGQPAALLINGEGYCPSVTVDWGDGKTMKTNALFTPSSGYHTELGGFHTYAKPGTYTVKVSDTGGTSCGTETLVATILPVTAPTANGPVQGQPGLVVGPGLVAGPDRTMQAHTGVSTPPRPKCAPGKPNKDCDPV